MANYFCEKLAESLYEENFEISTGLGLGVGRNIVTGFLNKDSFSGKTKLNSRLIIRPFPIQQAEEEKRKYREKILSECGVSIFLFGNKIEINKGEKRLIDSRGVIEEYNISRKLGHFIIPVSATGYVSEEIWSQEKNVILKRFSRNKEIINNYSKLNTKDQNIDHLVNKIIKLLKEYKLESNKYQKLIEREDY